MPFISLFSARVQYERLGPEQLWDHENMLETRLVRAIEER